MISAPTSEDLPELALLVQEALGELEAAMNELRGILEELGAEVEV
jgi:type I restriction enzyme M protein